MKKTTALKEVQVFEEKYYYKERIGFFKVIVVEDSSSECYKVLLKYSPKTEAGKEFKRNLKKAIETGVKRFRVPIYDPVIDGDLKLYFEENRHPAVGYAYNMLEKVAEENDVRLGTKHEYCLFLGTLIIRLINNGCSLNKAWNVVCNDSKSLGNYWDSEDKKHELEVTGCRKIVGKFDLGNTCKILAKDDNGIVWIAGGDYMCCGRYAPLARFRQLYDVTDYIGVGWYVV